VWCGVVWCVCVWCVCGVCVGEGGLFLADLTHKFPAYFSISIFSPIDNQPCADHDRSSGEGVGVPTLVYTCMHGCMCVCMYVCMYGCIL
jgi:hypothetical protein